MNLIGAKVYYDGSHWIAIPHTEHPFKRKRRKRKADKDKTVEQFEKAFNKTSKGKKVKYLLKGKLRCGHCGQNLIGESGTGRNGERRYYYKCRGRKVNITPCEKKILPKDLLESLVIDFTVKELSKPQNLQAAIKGILALQESRTKVNTALNSLLKEKREFETAIDNTMKAIAQGVINFYETQVEVKVDGIWTLLLSSWASLFVGDADVRYKRVSDVTILRLSFETDGEYYNLGVVDNKQTGSGKPINVSTKDPSDVPWWVWVIIVGVVVVVALVLICIFVPGAAPVIGKGLLTAGKGILFGIYYLFYGLFWLISLPFRLIANAIKNRKAKPKPSQSRKPAQKLKRKSKTKKAGKKK